MSRTSTPHLLRGLILAYAIILLVVLPACGGGKPNDLNIKVSDFTFTNQEGAAFGLADLKGKVWVANFIFTHCTTVCPNLTQNFAKLQQEMKKAGIKAELVSFSVDPGKDKPDVLKNYVRKFNAEFTNWNALTGYSDEQIQKFARSSFITPVAKDLNSDQVAHGTSFFLVNPKGTVVTSYDGMNPDFNKILKDIRALQK